MPSGEVKAKRLGLYKVGVVKRQPGRQQQKGLFGGIFVGLVTWFGHKKWQSPAAALCRCRARSNGLAASIKRAEKQLPV